MAIILCIILFGISVYKIFIKNVFSEKIIVNDSIEAPNIANISDNNYTNILKEVHDDLANYVGQKISFTGYIYRVSDILPDEFILARNMIINSNNETVVVGFLCKYNNAQEFADGTWVNITGKISKGDYHGEIPILEISNITKVDKPENEFVYPPDDYYVPTSVIY